MYVIVGVAALVVSALTLFSGFGLGTMLLPVFAIFFPITVAVSLVAVVHLLNNVFKIGLFGRHADWSVVVQFGAPALLTAVLGAYVLVNLATLEPILAYDLFGREAVVTPVEAAIALLIVLFVTLELTPKFSQLSFDSKYLPLGGLLSGFFGGVSGHQGALRSAFLIKTGLEKDAYIGTSVVLATIVDVGRLTVYGTQISVIAGGENIALLTIATLSAFVGALLGARLLTKVTMRSIQVLVSVMLLLIAVGLGSGLI